MKAKIIGGKYGKNISMFLENRVGSASLNYENLVIVDVNTIENDGQLFTDRIGLKIARDFAEDPRKVIVLLVAEPEEVLWAIPEFTELMALGNVGYTEFLAPQQIPGLYLSLSARKNARRNGV
ncbi:MAG: hypothetical protein Q8Q67_01990 [bacterium]|nr:hypothetical protein [bacterium]